MAVVYVITNLRNGKRYVGKTKWTLQKRWGVHLRDARAGSEYAIHRAIRKYGQDAFAIEVLATYETETEALQAEVEWVERLGTVGDGGYNMCRGGRGALGYRHTDEARARISAFAKSVGRVPPGSDLTGTRASEETRAKMRESQRQRRTAPVSDAFVENCRRAQRTRFQREQAAGVIRTQSDETRAKRAESLRAHWVDRKASGWAPPPISDETRAKLSAASKGHRRRPISPCCKVCGILQTPDNTNKNSKRSNGLQHRCRECTARYFRAWRAQHR